MYKVEFLPLAQQDLIDIVQYISKELENPEAAHRLADGLINAGERIAEFPYSNSAYIPVKPLKHEYRRLLVKSYIIFYWVDEASKIATIARVIYARRDYEKRLL